MGIKTSLSPVALALSAAFITSLAGIDVANAEQNPFGMTQLASGYMVSDSSMEGKCGEGKCGGAKAGAQKQGEGKCGMSMMDKNNDGNVSHAEFTEHHERMFARMDTNGDGIISASEMAAMNDQHHGLKAQEGKCGEGKCGGSKMMDKSDE